MAYLDQNASSPLREKARRTMEAALSACGNASSVHAAGRAARARVETAREQVARLAGAPAGAVVFTSGGSEANALALRGAVAGALEAEDRITRLFVSAIEYESVRANAAALALHQSQTKRRKVDDTILGHRNDIQLQSGHGLGQGRALVCVMVANNE